MNILTIDLDSFLNRKNAISESNKAFFSNLAQNGIELVFMSQMDESIIQNSVNGSEVLALGKFSHTPYSDNKKATMSEHEKSETVQNASLTGKPELAFYADTKGLAYFAPHFLNDHLPHPERTHPKNTEELEKAILKFFEQ